MIVNQDPKRYFTNGYDFYEIPDMRNKFVSKGKVFPVMYEVGAFLKSDLEACIIPVYCEETSVKKAFKSVTIITESEHFIFNNSEKGQYAWYRNDLKDIEAGNAYLVYFEKFARASHDCLIKSAKKIEKSHPSEGVCNSFVGTNIPEMIKKMDEILS